MGTGFLLHPRKAHFRARLNTFKPQGNDEIKHQHRVLYVHQRGKKKKKEKKHSACLLHLGFYTCVSAGHSSTHPRTHTWVRGPAGSSELRRCVWVKCQPARDWPRCFCSCLFTSCLSKSRPPSPAQTAHHPIWRSLALLTTLPSLFRATEPGSVAGFCSMWEVFEGLMCPVPCSPWLT